jgi:glucokinase
VSPIAIGVDVGGTKVLVAAVDPDAPIALLAERRVPTPEGSAALVEVITAAVRQVAEELGAAGRGPVAGVGVGLPGLVDRTGTLQGAPNLPGAVAAPVGADLAASLGLPVVVDNDANCATWAEVVAGAGRGARDALLVTLGTGIGGGLVLDGRLHHGAHGYAGEPGHMVVDPSGPICPCGRRGCWERYASGSGLAWLGQRAADSGAAPELARGGRAVTGEAVVAAARAGEVGARAVMAEFSWWLAAGLANLVDLFDPEVVLVGGGLADEADLFLDATREAFGQLVLGGAVRSATRVEAATLGSAAGAIGAALLAVEAGVPTPPPSRRR